MWIVPIEAGLEYMKTLFFGANLSNEQLKDQGKDNGPFACSDIENMTGKYDKTINRCGPAKSCRFICVRIFFFYFDPQVPKCDAARGQHQRARALHDDLFVQQRGNPAELSQRGHLPVVGDRPGQSLRRQHSLQRLYTVDTMLNSANKP